MLSPPVVSVRVARHSVAGDVPGRDTCRKRDIRGEE